jgi:hypothetical protein
MPSKTRQEHKFQGDDTVDSCIKCGFPRAKHRERPPRVDIRHRAERVYKPRKQKIVYIGLDGEGQGRRNHVYNMLCASDETGEQTWILESAHPDIQLTTVEILEFLLSFPRGVKVFTFSFNYDITKMLTDVDNQSLWKLARPEVRQRLGRDAFKGPRSVPWKGYRLNLQGTKFTVGYQNGPGVVIWDVWKFYQSKFTTALTQWKVGLKEEIDRMILMKDQRGRFDMLTRDEVRKYCLSECRLMATLARRLTEAHVAAGIPLKNYYGAGSSATAMLIKMNIRDYMREPSESMLKAVAQAFSGGRFDNSVIGTVKPKPGRKMRGADISSAYPYSTQFLPCLVHGRWERTIRRQNLDRVKVACVRYSLRESASVDTSARPWGPFPFRSADGSICYPAVSGGGWVWLSEFLEGERLFPNVQFMEAWIFHQECDCKPFKDMPGYYNERCRIGKEGPGIVLKLASNSVPGKTAQSVGSAPFRNYIWAGMINSQTRSQVLTALGLHRDWRDMLMVATDGIVSLDDTFDYPAPMDTGTNLPFKDDEGKLIRKPLGGWEVNDSDRGVFFARPGVYFPLNPSKDDLKKVRGRGVGRGVVLENWKMIIDRYESWDRAIVPGERDGFDADGWPTIKVANVTRFCGMKSSISRSMGPNGTFVYNRAAGNHIRGQKDDDGNLLEPPEYDSKGQLKTPEPAYGQWIVRQVSMSFNPDPKRLKDRIGEDNYLIPRKLPEWIESMPYDRANISEEGRQLKRLQAEQDEQPDKDFADYEQEDYNRL